MLSPDLKPPLDRLASDAKRAPETEAGRAAVGDNFDVSILPVLLAPLGRADLRMGLAGCHAGGTSAALKRRWQRTEDGSRPAEDTAILRLLRSIDACAHAAGAPIGARCPEVQMRVRSNESVLNKSLLADGATDMPSRMGRAQRARSIPRDTTAERHVIYRLAEAGPRTAAPRIPRDA